MNIIDELIKKNESIVTKSINEYIDNNLDYSMIDFKSNIVISPDKVTLVEFEFTRSQLITLSDDMINFEVILNCYVEIEETVKRNREVDEVNIDIILCGTIQCTDRLKNFSVSGCSIL